MTNLAFAAITAPLDNRLSPNDRHVLALIAGWPGAQYIDDAVRAGDITLDELCRRTRLPKPYVFYSVGRLEELGILPAGGVR